MTQVASCIIVQSPDHIQKFQRVDSSGIISPPPNPLSDQTSKADIQASLLTILLA